MNYRAFVSMNVAIIGSGKTSELLSRKLANAGHEIFIGLKEDDNDVYTRNLQDEYHNIQIYGIEEAASYADVIIVASEEKYVREVAYWLDDVRKKVVIDATNFITTLPGDGINTLNAIKAITGAPHVIKIFNSAPYKDVLKAFFKEAYFDMIVIGDSTKGKEVAKILAKDIGFNRCCDFGNDDTTLLLEEIVKCWNNFAKTNHITSRRTIKTAEQEAPNP